MAFKRGSCKLKKIIKNDEEKSFRNDTVQHVLLHYFLNDEITFQIMSPGKKKVI